MLHYKFPNIRTIEDVLPHISGRDEFTVKENKNYNYIVVSYAVQNPETFKWDENDEIGSAIRRECRGMIFSSIGNNRIIRRPLHKFRNVNEDEHVLSSNIDLSKPHSIKTKLDGSMISPFVSPESNMVLFGTKAGVTDIGNNAGRYANNYLSPSFHNWVLNRLKEGITPVFEWIGPDNRIVVNYKKEELVLLAMRDMVTGEYIRDERFYNFPGVIVNEHNFESDITKNAQHLINYCDGLSDEEGYVLTFDDGHMVKFKSSWYLRIHKIKEMVNSRRAIIEMLFDNKLDDALSVLPLSEHDYINNEVSEFWKVFHHASAVLEHNLEYIEKKYGDDRKRIALEFMPTVDKMSSTILFMSISRKQSVYDSLLSICKKYIQRSNKDFDEFMEWMRNI